MLPRVIILQFDTLSKPSLPFLLFLLLSDLLVHRNLIEILENVLIKPFRWHEYTPTLIHIDAVVMETGVVATRA